MMVVRPCACIRSAIRGAETEKVCCRLPVTASLPGRRGRATAGVPGLELALTQHRPAKSHVASFCCHATASAKQADAKAQILEAVQDTERGVSTSTQQKQRILQAVDTLAGVCGEQTTVQGAINASWKLIWTTEKETLFILKNAKRFGTQAGDVFQVIDLGNSSLQNVITFKNGASFVVDSSLEASDKKRLTFKFSGARLNLPSRTWRLPPFGKGWFDTIYLDDDIRVAKDIRGDTLIVGRDGPPRKF